MKELSVELYDYREYEGNYFFKATTKEPVEEIAEKAAEGNNGKPAFNL